MTGICYLFSLKCLAVKMIMRSDSTSVSASLTLTLSHLYVGAASSGFRPANRAVTTVVTMTVEHCTSYCLLIADVNLHRVTFWNKVCFQHFLVLFFFCPLKTVFLNSVASPKAISCNLFFIRHACAPAPSTHWLLENILRTFPKR